MVVCNLICVSSISLMGEIFFYLFTILSITFFSAVHHYLSTKIYILHLASLKYPLDFTELGLAIANKSLHTIILILISAMRTKLEQPFI